MREIKRFVRRGNANRESLSKELKMRIVRRSLIDFQQTKADGLIPAGMLKRDWIAMDTGLKCALRQDYLHMLEEASDKKNKQEQPSRYEDIQNSMNDVLKLPVKITDKQISIKIKNECDLARILELLGIETP